MKILIADDKEPSRKVLVDCWDIEAPSFTVSEEADPVNVIPRLLAAVQAGQPFDILILDRSFTRGQLIETVYTHDGITLAHHIRERHPELIATAILIYSIWQSNMLAAEKTSEERQMGIWYRSKAVKARDLIPIIQDIDADWKSAK